MQLLWETSEWSGNRVDQPINWLSWMSLEKPNSGYLAAGSASGTVGISITEFEPSIFSKSSSNSGDEPSIQRHLNYNLRGHRNPVCIVEWNQQHRRLASCDDGGVCYVWVSFDDRWSVELVNDRGFKIRNFVWSPSGELALICYIDSFVLVGSVSGQRLWSQHVENTTVLCGAWLPDEKGVVLGTSTGDIYIMNDQGAIVEQHVVWADHPIENLSWSAVRSHDLGSTLCVCFRNATLYFMRSCDDVDPVVRHTTLDAVIRTQWCQSGRYLAVVGTCATGGNALLIYNGSGSLLLNTRVPCTTNKPACGLCWGYDDQRIFISIGSELVVGCVYSEICSLRLLSSYSIWQLLRDCVLVRQLPLPSAEQRMVETQSLHTVQCPIPSAEDLVRCMCEPTTTRWYCTIIPEPQLATHLTAIFALCVEHMGGLVPILRGRQINKIRPEFEIRLHRSVSEITRKTPVNKVRTGGRQSTMRSGFERPRHASSTAATSAVSASADPSAVSMSPSRSSSDGFQRDNVWRRSKRQIQQMVLRAQQQFYVKLKERKIAHVTSNLWCTRFKVLGLETERLPPFIGEVVYKTSVLHLQPRQMAVNLVDLAMHKAKGARSSVPIPSSSEQEFDEADANLLPRLLDEGPPVAPLPAEMFGGAPQYVGGNEEDYGFVGDQSVSGGDVSLAASEAEERLLSHVLHEFDELKLAVDRHIKRMREFAHNLERTNQHQLSNTLAAASSARQPSHLRVHGDCSNNRMGAKLVEDAERLLADSEQTMTSAVGEATRLHTAAVMSASSRSSVLASSWDEMVATLDYIDEDNCTPQVNGSAGRDSTRSDACEMPKARLLSPATENGHSALTLPPAVPLVNGNHEDAQFAYRQSVLTGTPVKTRNYRQLREIAAMLDKMYKLASELAPRKMSSGAATASTLTVSSQPTSKISPLRLKLLPTVAMETEATNAVDGGYGELCTRLRELSRRVTQLESRINYGNELLDDIRRDLHQRVSNIRRTLQGKQLVHNEPPDTNLAGVCADDVADVGIARSRAALPLVTAGETGAEKSAKADDDVMVLHNKAPFWNEASQVYQLDFGGRVTQESAKNFQIEYKTKQIMQFGRIEHNSYTLDFQAPFSPVQAFAVALASITQRLK